MNTNLSKCLAILALVAVICLPGMAMADITLSAGLGFTWQMPQNGDPSLPPYTGGVPVNFTITSFTTYFTDPVAFSSNSVGGSAATIGLNDGWTGTYVTPAVSQASGSAISSGLVWNYNFQGSSLNAPGTFDIDYFDNNVFVGHEHYTITGYGGSNYTGGFDLTQDTPVPLPPSAMLLGSGLLGLGLLRRKWSLKS